MNMRSQHLLLAILMSLIFGMGWIFAKAAMSHFSPIFLAGLRFGVTSLVLVFFVKMPPRHMWTSIVLVSILAVSIPYSMSYTAMKNLNVSTAVLLAQMEAPALVVFGAFLLGEWPTKRQTVGILVAIGGVILIAGDPLGRGQLFAVFLAIGSVVTWAIGQTRIRTMGKELSGFTNLAWISLCATPQLLLLSLGFESNQLHALLSADLLTWAAVGYLGIIMTALGLGIWYTLIGKYPVVCQ